MTIDNYLPRCPACGYTGEIGILMKFDEEESQDYFECEMCGNEW